MRRTTPLRAAAAALLIGGALTSAPEARAGYIANGGSLDGLATNGRTLNGAATNMGWLNGQALNGRAAGDGVSRPDTR